MPRPRPTTRRQGDRWTSIGKSRRYDENCSVKVELNIRQTNKPLVMLNFDKTHQLIWDCLDMTWFHRIFLMMLSLPLVL